ncbi:DUF5819 family protein [Bogoriella caseilytica]|uniref:Uncharacterized protein n=1 Tax=Bogoriella caseilytica TaxID=56055 RepID=A0A3N2BE07_9MICO|nr:DUF5819 family protein [Bogoriella caseilytica]ROR73264.1 hypothetical protein EDD31_1639 [Bogoriella caseilytica]
MRRVPGWARLLVWPLVAAVLAHTFIIATWVGPATPIRQGIGAESLRSYVVPVFEQNWRLFAPDIRRREHSLEIRVNLIDEHGDAELTEWVDLVGLENQMIRHNPFPPRMYLAARRVANRINAASGAMSAEQLEQAQANYISNPVSGLGPALLNAGGDAPAGQHTVEAYLTFDEAATILASSFAANVWDGEVAHVQYRIATRAIPPFDDRHGQRIEDVEPTYRTFGWRPAHEVDEDLENLFAPYVRYEREQS